MGMISAAGIEAVSAPEARQSVRAEPIKDSGSGGFSA